MALAVGGGQPSVALKQSNALERPEMTKLSFDDSLIAAEPVTSTIASDAARG
jgi:hypothetical protein